MNVEKHAVDKKLEEVHQQVLEKNELKEAATKFWQKAKTGQLLGPRTLGIILAFIIGVGLVLFLFKSGKSEVSKNWTEFNTKITTKGLQTLVEENPKAPTSKLARLQIARVKLGPEGISRMTNIDAEVRKKAWSNVETAREEFLKLADDFKDDITLKAQCLTAAAEAELALVGIPKESNANEYRGNPDKAAEFYKQIASTAGASTKAGEYATKKAEDILANKQSIQTLGMTLYNQVNRSSALPPIAPSGLGSEKPPVKPETPGAVDLGPVPPKPSSAIIGGVNEVKKDDKKPEEKK